VQDSTRRSREIKLFQLNQSVQLRQPPPRDVGLGQIQLLQPGKMPELSKSVVRNTRAQQRQRSKFTQPTQID